MGHWHGIFKHTGCLPDYVIVIVIIRYEKLYIKVVLLCYLDVLWFDWITIDCRSFIRYNVYKLAWHSLAL